MVSVANLSDLPSTLGERFYSKILKKMDRGMCNILGEFFFLRLLNTIVQSTLPASGRGGLPNLPKFTLVFADCLKYSPFSLFSSLLSPFLPVLGWSVSVFIVQGCICQSVGRLVEFSVDVPYFPLHSLFC